MFDCFKLPLLDTLPSYAMGWLYGFMGPPHDFQIITADSRKSMKKQVIITRQNTQSCCTLTID